MKHVDGSERRKAPWFLGVVYAASQDLDINRQVHP